VQKHFDENKEKISAGERGELEDALKEARSTLDANKEATDADVFKGMFERLEKASHKIAEALYKAAGSKEGSQANEAGKKDDVIDAEYAA
jgi:molecular chaperone DnaK